MHAHMAPLLSLGFMLLLAASLVGSAAPPSGYRLELTHVDSKGSFSKSELMRRAVHRSRLRAAKLCATHGTGSTSATTTSPTWDARSKVHWSSNEYIVELAIGMPPVSFTAIADTGSDLIWAQSHPCTHCVPQPTPLYNPFASSSFSLEPCSSAMCQGKPLFPLYHDCSPAAGRRPQLCRYQYGYGDGAYSKGVLGRETLTFRGSTPGKFVSVAGVVFGCGNDNMGSLFNSTGTFGLGRGPLSAVAQLGFGKFSYCLTDYLETKLSSPLLFGSDADLTATGGVLVQSTPLVQVAQHATFYYVSLQGISIGETRLPIPEHVFEVQSNGTGGMFVDSGTSFHYYTNAHCQRFETVQCRRHGPIRPD